jgi:actin-related protein
MQPSFSLLLVSAHQKQYVLLNGISGGCRYTPSQQEALVSNVFLTGGNMLYPGMKERVERELLAMRPFQSHYKVVSSIKD